MGRRLHIPFLEDENGRVKPSKQTITFGAREKQHKQVCSRSSVEYM